VLKTGHDFFKEPTTLSSSSLSGTFRYLTCRLVNIEGYYTQRTPSVCILHVKIVSDANVENDLVASNVSTVNH
jgi:hypothetical protein